MVMGWFEKQNQDQLEMLIFKNEVHSVLEIGSFLGLSAIWFAKRVDRVTCIDTWTETAVTPNGNNLVGTLKELGLSRDFYHVFLTNVVEAGVIEKIFPVRGNSRDVYDLVGDHDLVYIDGDHSYEGCCSDILLYRPKARKVLCGDDFVLRKEFGVIPAVCELIPQNQLCLDPPFWWTVK